ncbi:MAG: GGDEF domain-containing protein [Gemmatimonadota bacterium]|nr:GGDEF domain-containing protein [Gemmatimonadota bacterium]
MSPERILGLVSYIGIIVQLVGAMLLALLFFVLRRDASRRTYFGVWTQGWIALVLAMSALVIRYDLVPGFDVLIMPEGAAERFLYGVYQLGKILYLAMLLGGSLAFARAIRLPRFHAIAMVLGICFATLPLLLKQTLGVVVMCQAPIAVLAYTGSSIVLLTLPRSRRSLGSRVTGFIFGAAAVLWVLYFFGFAASEGRMGSGLVSHFPTSWIAYNSYIDLLLQMLLAFGMVVMLMDDSKREADDARAELEVAHNQLRRTALYDPLTGALNRQAFEEGVGLESAKAMFGTVIVLDMDNLKTVNDSYGHAAGDMLLHQLVVVLRASLRPSDRLYRWGGDEFLLVLPGAQGVEVSERVQRAIDDSLPINVMGAPRGLKALVSLGASVYASGEALEHAIAAADAAMYKNKGERKRASGQVARAV